MRIMKICLTAAAFARTMLGGLHRRRLPKWVVGLDALPEDVAVQFGWYKHRLRWQEFSRRLVAWYDVGRWRYFLFRDKVEHFRFADLDDDFDDYDFRGFDMPWERSKRPRC